MMTNHHEEGTQNAQRSRSRLVFLKLISACSAVSAFTLVAMVVVAAQQQELPRFRSSVELTPMDVGVYDDRGQPVADLKPEDFIVRVDGNPRRVVNATWIPLEAPPGPSVKPPPDGYTANDNATSGRLILLVVDQPNIRFGGTRTIRRAANAFIDRLQPADRAAVVGIGPGSPSVGFTSDRRSCEKGDRGDGRSASRQRLPAAQYRAHRGVGRQAWYAWRARDGHRTRMRRHEQQSIQRRRSPDVRARSAA